MIVLKLYLVYKRIYFIQGERKKNNSKKSNFLMINVDELQLFIQWIDRQKDIYLNRQIDTQIDRYIDRQIQRQLNSQVVRYLDSQINIQLDREKIE